MVQIIDEKPELVLPEGDAELDEYLWPSQWLALETEANEVLFGGAKGPGKSFLIRFASILWACDAPGLQFYLFRREYPDLKQNHMEGPKGYPMMLSRMVAKKQCSIIPHELRFWNGSRVFLNHLQHSRYLGKYQGPEMHAVGFDELTQFLEDQYLYIRASVRLGSWRPPEKYRKTNFFPRILNGANPGGVGHAWVKQTFVDHGAHVIVDCNKLPPREDGTKEGGMRRVFIPARAEDNPSLLTYDPDYLDRLEGMGNPALVLAMREGNWDVVVGSMFGYVFRKRRHVLPRGFAIPVTWDIWRGGDDGFGAPAAVYWLTQNPDTQTIYVIAELYRKGMLPEEFAERTLGIDRNIEISFGGLSDIETGLNDLALDGEMDSAAFSETGASEKGPRGNQLNRMGCRWKPVSKERTSGIGFRVMRVQLMHAVLAPNKREPHDPHGVPWPGLRIFPNCPNLIRTIPNLPIDPDNPEDIDTDAEDHAFDALTYGLTRKKRSFARPRVKGV